MSPSDSLGVTWPELVERLRRKACLQGWAQSEPVLRFFENPVWLAQAVNDDCDPDRSDEILAALVRCAALAGRGDDDAALLVSYLLDNGSCLLAIRLRDLSPDIDELIAGALWIQIRTFPCHRRQRAIAKNLLLDTRRAVLRELCPDRRRDGSRRVTVTDPAALPRPHAAGFADRHRASDDDPRGTAELVEVLVWACRREVLAVGDVRLLIDLVAAAHQTDETVDPAGRHGLNVQADIAQVAQRWGLSEKTVRRRRDRALSALRDARAAYLDAVA